MDDLKDGEPRSAYNGILSIPVGDGSVSIFIVKSTVMQGIGVDESSVSFEHEAKDMEDAKELSRKSWS